MNEEQRRKLQHIALEVFERYLEALKKPAPRDIMFHAEYSETDPNEAWAFIRTNHPYGEYYVFVDTGYHLGGLVVENKPPESSDDKGSQA